MRNVSEYANGALMVGVLVAGAAISGYVFLTPAVHGTITKPLPGYDYVDGRITSSIESIYKQELPIRQHSVDLLNAITLVLFHEGRRGVLVGDKGWLFSAEEYAWTQRSETNLSANLHHIADVASQLKARGIALEIALVPEKADVYSDLLSRPLPSEHIGKYEVVRQQLARLTGAAVPDLRQVLSVASRDETVYFPTDTHWSVTGAGLAADALAKAFPQIADAPTESFALKAEPVVHHAGDLLNFLQLGPFSGLLPPTDDRVSSLSAVPEAAAADDFLGDAVDSGPAIALVGTSYSANALWSFEPQLKAALKRDVLNLAEEGHGPMQPMSAFLAKLQAGTVTVKAVIWEMPIRYLDDAPGAPTPGAI